MSNSRTLLRKLTSAPHRNQQRIKPGTPGRRVTELETDPRFDGLSVPDTHELSYHATKGFRLVRKSVA
jgi:hypothetical protein